MDIVQSILEVKKGESSSSEKDFIQSILEDKESEFNPSKSTKVHKDVELDIDLGTLLASDYNTLDANTFKSTPHSYLKNLTRDNVQLLINKIWELPIERVEDTVVVTLPKPQYVLPRSRVIPKPKPLTKWQQFAKEKGIQTKKKARSKLKWDEESKKWIPTYGYQRAKAEKEKNWLMEVKDNSDPQKDLFAKVKEAKQERQSKNELQRLRNIAKSKNIKLPKVGIPSVEHYPTSEKLSEAVTVARASTASVGKFQPRLPKEKDAKGIAKEVPGMKRKLKAPHLNSFNEKRQNRELVDNILKKKKVLRDDYSTGTAEIREGATSHRKERKNKKKNKQQASALKHSKNAKKPKAGKGKHNKHAKGSGRKRR